MSFWDLFTKKAEAWEFGRVPEAQTDNDIDIKVVNPNEEYLTIFLSSMWIVDVRKFLSQYYPAVHSFISVPYRDGADAEFNFVTTPSKLSALDKGSLDKVVNIDKPLVGPIPYRGGNVSIEIGLFSIKSGDLVSPFVDLLQDMSKLGGVSFIASALPYAEPIKKGLNLLFGTSKDTDLEIGLSKTFDKIQTGYYAVIGAPHEKIDVNDLNISGHTLMYKNGRAVTEYPYFIFKMFTTKARTDWFSIPEISTAFNKLNEIVKQDNYERTDEALKSFKFILYLNNDLLRDDARKIYSAVEKDVLELMPTKATGLAIEEKSLRPLEEYGYLFQ